MGLQRFALVAIHTFTFFGFIVVDIPVGGDLPTLFTFRFYGRRYILKQLVYPAVIPTRLTGR
jgi:hypothetical protein